MNTCSLFHKPALNHVYKTAFVIYSGSVLWNSLPVQVRQLTSLKVLNPKLNNLISIVKLLKLAIRNFYTRTPCKAVFFYHLYYLIFILGSSLVR